MDTKLDSPDKVRKFLLLVYAGATDLFRSTNACSIDERGRCAGFRNALNEIESKITKWESVLLPLRRARRTLLYMFNEETCCVGCNHLGKRGCKTKNVSCALFICPFLKKERPELFREVEKLSAWATKILTESGFSVDLPYLVRLSFDEYVEALFANYGATKTDRKRFVNFKLP